MPTAPASSDAARHQLARRLNAAVAGLDDPATPMVVVDLDAFDANAADLARRAGGKPVRVASKSLRVPALVQRALAAPGFAGVLAYSLREALWLVREGVTDDVVMGYPTRRPRCACATSSPTSEARARDHADGRRPRPPVAGRGLRGRGRAASGWPSTSTRACGWAAPTSGPSARRCTSRARSCAFAQEVARPRVLAGRGDDLRGPGGRRAGRRTQPAGHVARRTQAEGRLDRPARGATDRDRARPARAGRARVLERRRARAASSPPSPTRW